MSSNEPKYLRIPKKWITPENLEDHIDNRNTENTHIYQVVRILSNRIAALEERLKALEGDGK